jgi:hypothetical protein
VRRIAPRILASDQRLSKTESELTGIAVQLASILGPDHCVLVGALAVAVHGYPRATDDVDLLTRLDLKEAGNLLAARGIDTVMKRGDILEGDFSCLQGTLDGVRFDILPQLVPVQWNSSVSLNFSGAVLKVVDLDALVRLKLRAGGPQDLADAAHLLMLHPDRIGRAREAARAYRLEDKLDVWLNHPRTRTQVEDELRGRGEEGRKILKQLAATLPRTPARRKKS